jgi:hypothetical protein
MNWAPLERVLCNFFLPLVDGAEYFVVLVQVLAELFEQISDVLVYPVAVLQFAH